MKNWLFFAFILFSNLLISSLGNTQTLQPQTKSPKFIVFLLHGFLGSEATFCDLQKTLQKEYGDDLVVENLSFPTFGEKGAPKDSEMNFNNVNTATFSQIVFKGIFDAFDKHQLAADTPYAVVAHSLGGIITLRLALECFTQPKASYCQNSNKKSKITSIPTNLSHLITFMTPFWGSTTANRIIRSPLYMALFPDQQTRDLAVGSDLIDQTRKEIIQRNLNKEPVFATHTQIINISASFDEGFYAWGMRQTADISESGVLETDPAVPAPSSRMDFLYKLIDKSGFAREGNTNLAQAFYPLHGVHGKVPSSDNGLACVNSQNQSSSAGYAILKKYFNPVLKDNFQDLPNPILSIADIIPKLTTFRLEVRMNLPDDSFLLGAFSADKISFSTLNNSSAIDSLKKKNDFTDDYTSFNTDSRTKKNYVTFFRTGYFFSATGFAAPSNFLTTNESLPKEEINVDIRLPWYQEMHFTAPVSPSYSTYVEVDLENRPQKFINQLNLSESKAPTALSVFAYSEKIGIFGGYKGARDHVRTLIFDPKTESLQLQEGLAKNYQGEAQTLKESCYVASVDAFRQNQLLYYKNFRDQTPDYRVPLERDYNVFARVTDGEKQADGYYAIDRVLVTDHKVAEYYGAMWPRPGKKSLGVVWMNTRDVRLLRPCDPQP